FPDLSSGLRCAFCLQRFGMRAESVWSNEMPNGLRNLHRTFHSANDSTRTRQLVVRSFARFRILLELSCKLGSTRPGSRRPRTFRSGGEDLAYCVFGFIPKTRFSLLRSGLRVGYKTGRGWGN